MLDLGLLILRTVVGLLFVGHGAQKLLGWFGGGGLGGTAAWMEQLGLRPGRLWALVAGLAEFVGGALLALGLLVPVAAVLIVAVMAVAIALVHARNGLWVQNGGYEYPLVNSAAAVAVALMGPGAYALEPVLGLHVPAEPVVAWGLVLAVLLAAFLGLRSAQQPAQA
jgi:putative oxidoreductase